MLSETSDCLSSDEEELNLKLRKKKIFILNHQVQQYVQEVIDYSSQYGHDNSISYAAINIIGKPSKFPDYGDFPETFAMRSYGHYWKELQSAPEQIRPQDCTDNYPMQDFIIVSFDEYVLPEKIHIYETFNPGAVVSIYAWGFTNKKWDLLWKGEPHICEKLARELVVEFSDISVPTKILRIEFNHSLLDYYTAIDGVLLTGQKCVVLNEDETFDLARFKGPILQKLENFTVSSNPCEPIQQAINKFIENAEVSAGSSLSEKNNNRFIEVDVPANEMEINCDTTHNLSELPNEVLLKIMSLLDLKSLYNCSSVCRKFREISSDPLLYLEVNLKVYFNLATSSLLKSLQKRATLIRKLDLSTCGLFQMIESQDFREFVKSNGKTLTHLRLDNCKFLNNRGLEAICVNCSNLKELSIRNYISSYETNSRDFFCLSMLNQLERLDLFRSGIETVALLNVLKNNPNLKHLNLGFSPSTVNLDDVCLQLKSYNKNIVSIDFWKSHSLTAVGIAALSECVHLEEVDLGWCLREVAEPSESLRMLMQNCTNLKKLNLAAIRGFTDRDLDNIAKFCKNLEQLDLMGILGISTEMCLRIVQNCRHLKLFDLSFCDQLDDDQLMTWQNEYDVSIKRSFVSFSD